MSFLKNDSFLWLIRVFFFSALLVCKADVHYYDFFVREANFTKLCNTSTLLVVNDSYPGLEIRVHRGDTVFVNVHNQGNYGLTIHWHGVSQPRNPWSDGPEFVTQCPVQPGTNFTYQVILSDEIGTLWWHAHSDWSRGSVHGAFVILPTENESYPFPTPDADETILLQSWYGREYKKIIDESLASGVSPPNPDANAINGHLGDTYGCPNDTIFRMQVDSQKTYLLRIINAHMNEQQFFSIMNHSLVVVAQDASYVQMFTSDYILISPGQTMDVLLVANQKAGHYYMATRPFSDSIFKPNDNITTGILQYTTSIGGLDASTISLPQMNDTNAAISFVSRIKNSNVTQNPPLDVPTTIDKRIYISTATNNLPCKTDTCVYNTTYAASMNNVSFQFPRTDILQAYYNRSINGVFTEDFPLAPPVMFDFTGNSSDLNTNPERGTRAVVLNYNESVEIVIQTTSLVAGGSHPIHLHGYNFYCVGSGKGNFNNETDPNSYNLVDPPLVNTIHARGGGWTAIRFFARNPGVWFMHCHYERHTSWGLDTVFIVKNGSTVDTSILPPPATGMPHCLGT